MVVLTNLGPSVTPCLHKQPNRSRMSQWLFPGWIGMWINYPIIKVVNEFMLLEIIEDSRGWGQGMAAENFITQSYHTHTQCSCYFSQSMGVEDISDFSGLVWCEELLLQWVWFREAMSELCILLLRSCRMPFVSFYSWGHSRVRQPYEHFPFGWRREIKIGGTISKLKSHLPNRWLW